MRSAKQGNPQVPQIAAMASDWTSVVKLWSPEQQSKEDDDDDDDDDDKTSMCIITGTLFIGTKFEKKNCQSLTSNFH